VVTDEMVQAAVTAYDDECEDFDTEAHDAPDMHTSAMRAAITAALEASGLLELIAKADKMATACDGIYDKAKNLTTAVLEASSEIERLREALQLYGDRIAMANAPPHLQQEIDTALAGAS
jgi:hypothetical protein